MTHAALIKPRVAHLGPAETIKITEASQALITSRLIVAHRSRAGAAGGSVGALVNVAARIGAG